MQSAEISRSCKVRQGWKLSRRYSRGNLEWIREDGATFERFDVLTFLILRSNKQYVSFLSPSYVWTYKFGVVEMRTKSGWICCWTKPGWNCPGRKVDENCCLKFRPGLTQFSSPARLFRSILTEKRDGRRVKVGRKRDERRMKSRGLLPVPKSSHFRPSVVPTPSGSFHFISSRVSETFEMIILQ